MKSHQRKWIGALLLPLTLNALATEPPASASSTRTAPSDTRATLLASSFDLRGTRVQEVVRATASTQASYGYFEPRNSPSPNSKLAAALRYERPVARKPPAPRIPDPTLTPPCDGFWSCGLEVLLDRSDLSREDERDLYARQLRHRLMQQGSFTYSTDTDAGVPRSPLGGR
jgi:hypothetical protein